LSKQVTADKRKYVTLTVPYKLEIIRGLESGGKKKVVMASYNVGSSTLSDIQNRILTYLLTYLLHGAESFLRS
jgi:hypothetical protein